ncbi:hypothetical protein B9T31_08415, partial [Acinetobacter sp. ANC 4558]|uniref:M14 family metallopeptidase n=1 Tax=Acinetobacter sp. ANC 4558 TaxID=1977876 RepID=UPI000B713CCD
RGFANKAALEKYKPSIEGSLAQDMETKKVWLWDGAKWNDTGASDKDLAIAHSDAEIAKTNTALANVKDEVSQKADVLFDFHTKSILNEKTVWSGIDEVGNVLVAIDKYGNVVPNFLYDFHTEIEKPSYILVDFDFNILQKTGNEKDENEVYIDFYTVKDDSIFLTVDLNFNILNSNSVPKKDDESTNQIDFSKLQLSQVYPNDITHGDVYRNFDSVKVQNNYADAIYHASVWSLLPDHQSVYRLYDGLVAKSSSKLKSEVLGVDSDGNEIRAYIYTPKALQYGSDTPEVSWGKELTSPPKILITTGVHGNEKDAILQFYLIMKRVIETTFEDEDIALIAQTQLIIVPVVNPSGVNLNTRYNARKIDLNRNSPTDWSKSDTAAGPRPLSEPESVIVSALPERFPDCDYYIDFHNFNIAGSRLAWFATAKEETLPLIRKVSLHINTVMRRDYIFPASWPVRLSINAGGTFARHWQLGLDKQGFLLETPREEVGSNPFSIYKVRQHGINVIKHALHEIINFKMLNPTI